MCGETGNLDPEVEARLKLVQARVQSTLDPSSQAVVREGIERHLELRQHLRSVTLSNHDEPIPSFTPMPASYGDD